jgi:murein L,D-transpeptidase YcbB/YkuD
MNIRKNIYENIEGTMADYPECEVHVEEIKQETSINSKLKSSYPGYLIKKDNKKFDWNVVRIQRKLVELGYKVGNFGSDGYFGEETKKAVKAFQQDISIVADGVVGKSTWGKLFE